MSHKSAGQSQVVIAMVLPMVLLGVAMTGCVLITPTTKQIESASGRATQLSKHPPIPGKTTRRDVEEHYQDFAVETGVPNLFWSRFRKSAWMISAGNYTTSYSTRIWGVKNILITFDADAVKSYEIVEGDKYLFNRLLALLKEQGVPPLDLTQPVTVRGWYASSWECRITIDLNASEVAVTKALPRKSWKEPAPPPQVARIPVAQVSEVVLGLGRSDADLNVGAAFRFVEKTDVGKEVAFKTPPEAVVVLARWMKQVGLEKRQR